MEEACKGPKSESSSTGILEVFGEPVIVINGVPNAGPSNNDIPAHLHSASDAGSKNNRVYGRLMEGRKVQKLFGKKYYAGKVVKFDAETNWYQVVYEDGDFEDMEWHELQEVLLPLNIATPLTKLASKILEKPKSMSATDKAELRKGYREQIVGGNRQMVILETQSRSGRPIKPNARYGRSMLEKSKRARKILAVRGKKSRGRPIKTSRNMSEAKEFY